MREFKGVEDLGLFRVIGQPNLNFTVDRAAAARYGINVADVQDAIQTAVGGNAVTQVLQGEARYDLVAALPAAVPRHPGSHRQHPPARALRRARLSRPALTNVKTDDGAEEIYREASQRYVAIKYSVRGRDLGCTVEEAIRKVNAQVEAAHRLQHRLGRRVREPEALLAPPR